MSNKLLLMTQMNANVLQKLYSAQDPLRLLQGPMLSAVAGTFSHGAK